MMPAASDVVKHSRQSRGERNAYRREWGTLRAQTEARMLRNVRGPDL